MSTSAAATSNLHMATIVATLPLSVVGPVVEGDRRGRTLGFPTANLVLDGDDVTDGVYAARFVTADSASHAAAVSVGRRLTFYREGIRLLEAHVLDYSGDLYGQRVTIELLSFLRGQRRFADVGELVAQLHGDVDALRALMVV